MLAVAERGARRAAAPSRRSPSATRPDGRRRSSSSCPAPTSRSRRARRRRRPRAAGGAAGHTFALGRSRRAVDPADLHRAASEALLAANVAEGDAERAGARLRGDGRLPPAAVGDERGPGELQRFYAETVEPLVAYDEQYETDLVQTVEAFLDADGNVAGTAQRLFTHRHTIRYRLERVRELSGLDVGSTDGREKLSLGPEGDARARIAHRAGRPARRAPAGRVPRGADRHGRALAEGERLRANLPMVRTRFVGAASLPSSSRGNTAASLQVHGQRPDQSA